MSRLDLSDNKVTQGIDSVINATFDDEKKNPWVLLTHIGQTNKLKVEETGDEFDEFIDSLNDGKLMYGLMKFNINGVYKCAYISYCPDGVDAMTKGKFGMWNKDMEFTLKGKYHTEVMARQEEDIDLKQILAKLKLATGSSYATIGGRIGSTVDPAKQNISKRQQESLNPTNVQRIDTMYQDEKLKQKSSEFWSQQQQREEEEKKKNGGGGTTNTRTAKQDLEAIKQNRNQFWSKEQQQQQQEVSSSTGSGGAAKELENLKQKSSDFWSKQQDDTSSSGTTKVSPVVKADVGALRNRFAEQARVSSETTITASSKPPVVTKSLKERLAEQEQHIAAAAASSSQQSERVSPRRAPPSFHQQQQQQQQQQEYEEPETTSHLPPPPTTAAAATTTSHLPPPPFKHQQVEEEEDDEFDEPEPANQQYYDEPEPPKQQTSTFLPPPPFPNQPQYEAEEEEEDQFDEPEPASTYTTTTTTSEGTRYRAMYDFESSDAEELSFMEGDIMVVLKDEGDWWTAYREADITKSSGYIPANYVEPL